MKITSIKTELKELALKTAFITALRRVESVSFVRVTFVYDNGSVSYGEAPATKAITGEGIEDILNSINSIKKSLLHKTTQSALDFLHEKSKIGSSAKAALDMALVSMLGEEKGLKLYEYFGVKESIKLQTDITISLKSTKEMLHDAVEAFEKGMSILKVKVGNDIAHAVEITQKLSQNLPEAKLLIDANQAWTLADSLVFLEQTEGLKIELIEQPVKADDLESLKVITNATKIPILADESAFTLSDVKNIVESKSANMINIKLMKCGGLTNAIKILEYAREAKVTCMLGSMLEGPYSINAALHLAMAYSDVIKYIDLDSPLLYKIASESLEFEFNGSYITYKNGDLK